MTLPILFIRLLIRPSIRLFIRLSIRLFIRLFIRLILLLMGTMSCELLAEDGILETCGKIQCNGLLESSGFAKSRSYEGVYWTHGDSPGQFSLRPGPKKKGFPNRLYAFRADGTCACQTETENTNAQARAGIDLGIRNRDWEDITIDPEGNIYLGDFGNNGNQRKNLCVYVFPEPDPRLAKLPAPPRKLDFRYPDQKTFPAKEWRFDCEAMIFHAGFLYLATKQTDFHSTLYRLDPKKTEPQLAEKLGVIKRVGMVTAADISPSGKQLALLSVGRVHLYDMDLPIDVLSQTARPFSVTSTGMAEALVFESEDSLLIGNESGALFRLRIPSP